MAALEKIRSVLACEEHTWHLHLWLPSRGPDSQMRVPFCCRSWRHQGSCREWKGAQDFVRCAEAITSRKHWSYLVLTFAQRSWPDKCAQARAGVGCWSKLRKRLTREFGKIPYIQTWEAHVKGGFHCNVAVANKVIYDIVRRLESPEWWLWLRHHAEQSGFGPVCWAEPIRGSQEQLAGYLTKLSRELTGAGAKNQVPVLAPPHFRRLRASQGLLPPVHSSDWTGRLVFAPLESFGVSRAASSRAVT